VQTLTLGTAIAFLLNTFSPLLIQYLQSVKWPTAAKFVVAAAAAGAVGALSAYVAGQLTGLPADWTGYVIDAAIVIPYAGTWYDKVWHPMGLASAKLGITKSALATSYTQADLDNAVATALAKYTIATPPTPPTQQGGGV